MKHSVRLVAAAIACGALLATTACAPSEENSDGPVDLTMAVWTTNEKQLAVFDEIAAAYVAEHGDTVKSVTFQPLSGNYLTTLTTQIAGGSTPDLAWVAEANATEFVESSVLKDVSTQFEDSADFDLADVTTGALDLWKDGDAIYAYPFSTSPFGIYVNRDLVEAAGQPQPADLLAEGKWTWDAAAEIGAASAKASAGTGPIVIGTFPDLQWDGLAPVYAAWGASPWDESGTTCTFDSSEMSEAISWYHEQVYDAGAFRKPGEKFDFNSGGAAMLLAQMSSSGGIDESVNWDFLPLPEGPAGQVDVIGQAAIGVIAKGAHPDIAADFLTYFTDAENSAKLAQFFPSSRQSLLNVETLKQAAPALSEEQIQEAVIDAIPDAITKSNSVIYSQITPLVQTALGELWNPDADTDDVLAKVCDAIQPKLDAIEG